MKTKLSRHLVFIMVFSALFLIVFARNHPRIGFENLFLRRAQGGEVLKSEAKRIKGVCFGKEALADSEDKWVRRVCYAEEMEKMAYKYGQEDSRRILTELQSIDHDSQSCHIIAHGIGWGVYRSAPHKMRELVDKSSSFCNGGEQHGIIEKHMESLPGSLTKEQVPKICGETPKSDCNRMVGHMLLVETQNDMDKAIDFCSALSNEEQAFICYGGLMMERFIGYNLMDHGIIPREDLTKKLFDFRDYCQTLSGSIEMACWQGLAHPAYYYFDREAEKVLEFCNTAPIMQAARECKIHSLSELVDVLKVDINTSKSVCKLDKSGDYLFEKNCYLELASLYLKPDLINLENANGVSFFCSSLDLSFRRECYGSIANSLEIAGSSPERSEKICSGASKEYLEICKGS